MLMHTFTLTECEGCGCPHSDHYIGDRFFCDGCYYERIKPEIEARLAMVYATIDEVAMIAVFPHLERD
jgi:hypothetical protein